MFDVPVYTSPKVNDCAATCLKMIADYYDVEVGTIADLAKELNTRLIGCTALDLKNVAISHGMNFKAFNMEAEELYSETKPAIIWWKYKHFVVFCGMNDKDEPVIINPDRGRFSLDKGSFESMYTKVAIFNGPFENLQEE